MVAGTTSGQVWCITAADNRIGSTPYGTPYTWGFEHTRHRTCAANGRSTISTRGFKHTRHRRCATNGRDITPDIRACTDADLRVTLTTACIKGKVSIVDTALPSDIGARLDPSDDTSYLSIRQATHNIIAKSVNATAAAAAAHNWPSLDSDTYLDTECGPCARTPSQAAVRTAEAASPRSQTTPTRTAEGRGPAPVPTPELPPSPPRIPSPTPTENRLREEPPEDCCVCYEALAFLLVYLTSCSHRVYLPCYAARRVRAEADLRCPACRATVTVNEADRMALRQHSNEVMVEVLTVARQEMPADGETRLTTRATRGDRRRRAICSVCHGLVEETNGVQVPCSCDVHHRCDLGFCKDAIPRDRTFGGVHLVTCPNPALHEEHQESIYTLSSNRFGLLAGR